MGVVQIEKDGKQIRVEKAAVSVYAKRGWKPVKETATASVKNTPYSNPYTSR